MIAEVWFVGPVTERLARIESALADAKVPVRRGAPDDLTQVVLQLYDARGLLLLDAETEAGRAALDTRDSALIPVLALAAEQTALPPGVLRLLPDLEDAVAVHHIREVLNEPDNLRRHPRVPVALPITVGAHQATTRDLSLYGVWLSPAPPETDTADVTLTLQLHGEATIQLDGRVVSRRPDGAAVRTRPHTDEDLLLWVNLLLEHLADSPLHAEADLFEPLFDGDRTGQRPQD